MIKPMRMKALNTYNKPNDSIPPYTPRPETNHSGNIRGTFREHPRNIQGTFREYPGNS
jgi:hypothetical protein